MIEKLTPSGVTPRRGFRGVARRVAGFVLGWLVRVLCWSWRVRVVVPDGLLQRPEPLVFAFWHGRQLALLGVVRRRPALVMVSHSRDGAIQTSVMRELGFRVVRGSTSRGASSATKQIVRELGQGEWDAVFAVDGPRGPLRRAKRGAAKVAELAAGALVPLGSAASHCFLLRRAWDQFEIPLPFARIVVVARAPIDPRRPELVSAAIDEASRQAARELNRPKLSPESVEQA